MRNYNVHEAVKLLDKYYITDSIQMVTRWLRERKIAGVPSSNRKNGWIITEEELFAFIEEKRPGLPQIMSVYEEYIKNLTIEKNEEWRDKYTNEEAIHQVDCKKKEKDDGQHYNSDLAEQNQSLEGMVQQLLEEHSLLNQSMVEVITQNQDLIEENKTLIELFEIMDKELKELKSTKEKTNQKEDKNTNKKKTDVKGKDKRNIKLEMPYKSFCAIANEGSEQSNKKIEKSKLDSIIKEVYGLLCENEKIKGELVNESGFISCPFSNKPFKQPKRFIKHAVQRFIERHEKGVQVTLEMLS
ncbi:hypothetical protein [Litchfieldia alkalitelluris]|uniref:hypothetical protein n=1 Tax=Litchfieldia alkalitelluris TaxID=304268 RepID=UPI00195BB798|nr:hypothetical protein [Litchfieldia alkalitelluris]